MNENDNFTSKDLMPIRVFRDLASGPRGEMRIKGVGRFTAALVLTVPIATLATGFIVARTLNRAVSSFNRRFPY